MFIYFNIRILVLPNKAQRESSSSYLEDKLAYCNLLRSWEDFSRLCREEPKTQTTLVIVFQERGQAVWFSASAS